MDAKIKNAVNEIIKFTDKLSQKYQTDAFKILLNHFLINSTTSHQANTVVKKSTTSHQANTVVKKSTNTSKKTNASDMKMILNSNFDWSKLDLMGMNGLKLYLSILDVVKNNFNITSLSTPEIHNILKEKYRKECSVNAIGMALLNVQGKYVLRVRNGNSYKHEITPSGIKFISKFKKNNQGAKI